MANKDNATLRKSKFPLCGARYSGSKNGTTTNKTTITGIVTRNTDPHQKNSKRDPPTNGPAAMPNENMITQMPIARDRCRESTNMLLIKARVEGIKVAPATPSIARAKISISALAEYAASADAIPKAVAPIINNFRRPIRSPNVPIVIKKPAIKIP